MFMENKVQFQDLTADEMSRLIEGKAASDKLLLQENYGNTVLL